MCPEFYWAFLKVELGGLDTQSKSYIGPFWVKVYVLSQDPVSGRKSAFYFHLVFVKWIKKVYPHWYTYIVYSPYSQIFQNETSTANEYVRFIVTYAVMVILWSIRHNWILRRKGLRFASHTVWVDQRSLGRWKNQQTTIILILGYVAYSILNKDTELITNKKHQQLHARCDICRGCLVTVSIWWIRE